MPQEIGSDDGLLLEVATSWQRGLEATATPCVGQLASRCSLLPTGGASRDCLFPTIRAFSPEMAPEAPNVPPRSLQEAPKRPQEAPKRPPQRPQENA